VVATGVSDDCAAAVYELAKFYYPKNLTPYPEDRWTATLGVDPEDLEDFAAEWWERNKWPKPSPADPVVIPADPSLIELATWLDSTKAASH
jgi:hypothetical protein